MNKEQSTEICCPPFDVSQWDDVMHDWNEKHFIKDNIKTFLFMPINFGSVMRRLDNKVRMAQANIIDNLCLADHTSKWNMDIYLAVDKVVDGCETAFLSGKFYSKVYEGPFKDTGKWCKDYDFLVSKKGLKVIKMYMWYTTCPKCAKKYGKNYTVIISKVE